MKDSWARLGLAALVAWLLQDPVFRGHVFYERDVHLQWQPQAESLVRCVAAGAWPVWDPDVAFGMPLLANANNEALYPFTVLHLFLRPPAYYTFFVAAHLLLGALGLHALGRRLGLSPGGGFVAGALWIASGPILSLANVWNHLAGAAWIPWAMLAADAAAVSGRATQLVFLAGALAGPLLAGSPDMALMAWALAALHALRRGAARGFAVAAVLALGLTAAQWMPTLAYLGGTARAHLAAEDRTYWSLHPLTLIETLWPVSLGDLPLQGPVSAALFESREPFLRSVYLGLPALGLVAVALTAGRSPHRRFLLAILIGATLLALGSHGALYDVAAAVVPPFKALRFPAKFMAVAALAWALLAGAGFDSWREAVPSRKRLWPLAAGVVAAGWLAWAMGSRAADVGARLLVREPNGPSFAAILAPTAFALAAAAALGAVVLLARRSWVVAAVAVADLALRHAHLNPTAPPQLYAYRPLAVDAIRRDGGRRIYVYDYAHIEGSSERRLGRASAYRIPMPGVDPASRWIEAAALREYILPPIGGVFGLAGSFDADLLKLQPTGTAELTALVHAAEGTPLEVRLLRMGGVTHVVALHGDGLETLTPLAVVPGHFLDPIRIFRVPSPMPETYVVAGARIAAGATAIGALADPAFDPSREVVLDSGPPHDPAGAAVGTSRVVERRPDRVRIEADLVSEGVVVLLDAYDAGWRATLDGRPAEVARANVAFRALRTPAGRHAIEMVYRPPALIAGLFLSGAALLLATVLARTP